MKFVLILVVVGIVAVQAGHLNGDGSWKNEGEIAHEGKHHLHQDEDYQDEEPAFDHHEKHHGKHDFDHKHGLGDDHHHHHKKDHGHEHHGNGFKKHHGYGNGNGEESW